jgi:predicted permease
MNLRKFFQRSQRDRELSTEIESYIEHEIDLNVALGMSRRNATDAARRKFGNSTLIREESYQMNTIRPVEMILQDLKYGLRQLRHSPGFAVTAILSLALGVGANTAIFQLLNAVRLRSLPVPNPQELAEVKIAGGNTGFGVSDGSASEATYPLWEQIRGNQKAFSSIFAWSTGYINIGKGSQRKPGVNLWLTGSAFQTLGIVPTRGRLLAPEDDKAGCGAGPAVISHSFWQREFGGRDDAIGSQLVIDEHSFTVAGVTPPGFFGLEVGKTFDVALPVCAMAIWNYPLARRDLWFLDMVGRLNPGWTLALAAEHLKVISPGLFEESAPAGYSTQAIQRWRNFRLTASPGGSGISRLRREYESSLWLLLGITGLVLLIACANLANLLLARAGTRQREMAVRLSIGASRGRLIGQLFSESLILAGLGGACGAGLALFLSQLLIRFISTDHDKFELNLDADWRMLAFTVAVAFATCVLFGLAPALRATRVDASAAMKSGGRGTTADRSRFGFQQVLIASQVAVSLVLVTGALLFVTSFRRLNTLDTGFRQEGLVISNIGFERLSVPKEKILAYQDRLLATIQAIPGVQSASTTTHTPLDGTSWTLAVRVPGFEGKGKDWSKFTWVRPRYFETLSLPLLAGRDFNDFDTAASRNVIIINETFARLVFGDANPIGRSVVTLAEPGYPETVNEVVGVVKDSNYAALREKTPPVSYAPATQNPRLVPWIAIVTRSTLPSNQIAASVQRAMALINPDLNVRIEVLREMIEDSLSRERTLAWLSGFFGALAALLAMIGLYGVISYMVARRQSEIGIRLALGSGRSEILGLILRQVTGVVGIGLAVGIALSLIATRGLGNLLFGLAPNDPVTLITGVAGLALVALFASFIPALRASKVDPMVALRQE